MNNNKDRGFGDVWGHRDEKNSAKADMSRTATFDYITDDGEEPLYIPARKNNFKMPEHVRIGIAPPTPQAFADAKSPKLEELEVLDELLDELDEEYEEEVGATLHDIADNTARLEKEISASAKARDRTAAVLAAQLQSDLQSTISAEKQAFMRGVGAYNPKEYTAKPPNRTSRAKVPHKTVKNIEPRGSRIYLGFPAAVFSLLFFGVVFTVTLFFPAGEIFPLRFAPLILLFLGVEFVVRFLFMRRQTAANNGGGFVFDRAGVILIAACVAVSAVMSLTGQALGDSENERKHLVSELTHDAEIQLEKKIIAALSEYPDGIALSSVQCSLTVNDAGLGGYYSISDIRETDELNLTVAFSGIPGSVKSFADRVRICLDVIAEMKLPADDIDFRVADIYSHVDCHINGRTEMSLSASDIAMRTTFYIDGSANIYADLYDNE